MIDRNPLREEIRQELLSRLIRGELSVGTNINEVALAEEFGVSRTPLREALLSLELEGLLEARPRRGWWVAPLTPRVVREVYPIISALEVLALETADRTTLRAQLSELTDLNKSMHEVSHDPIEAQRADDAWHKCLIAACPNERLREIIATLKPIVHRYEFAYMRQEPSVPLSVSQHEDILEAIANEDISAAIQSLRDNWNHGMNVLLAWLESHEPEKR